MKLKVKKPKAVIKTTLYAVGVIFIFWVGVLVGDGKIQISGLKSENKNLPANLNYSSVEQVYDSLRQNYDGNLNVNELLDGLKHGLVQSVGDPYTDYFTPKEASDFNNELDGCINGIGAQLGKDKDNNLTVIAPIANSPAAKAGLKSQDIIEAVD
ncbi:MAG: S41 family peptidase, partial [Minisyncoccia bacterium]